MDVAIHSIGLFEQIVAPRHTAFNTWILDKFEKFQKRGNPEQKKNKRPSERWHDLEWFSVLNRSWNIESTWHGFRSDTKVFIFCFRCRAPPWSRIVTFNF